MRDKALRPWKCRWVMLGRWRVRILIETRFMDMIFAWCEQKLLYCCQFRDEIDAKLEAVEGDSDLWCWFFDKPYKNLYLMHDSTHRTRALQPKVSQRTAVRHPVFVE